MSDYITREGWEKLSQERDYLWRKKRPEITRIVSFAAAQGDRSENGDYLYNKKLLREIDRRIHFLNKRLQQLKVVDYDPQQQGRVFFGAYVEIEDNHGKISRFRIVGKDEIGHNKNYISIHAPMAKAVLGKQVDDEVLVHLPQGKRSVIINKIQYQPFTETLADTEG